VLEGRGALAHTSRYYAHGFHGAAAFLLIVFDVWRLDSWLAFFVPLARMGTVKQMLLPLLLLTVAWGRAAPILPEEAKDHIAENASVRGLVEQVSLSQKGNAFLNFGRRFSQALCRCST